jgi:hypothetical protein
MWWGVSRISRNQVERLLTAGRIESATRLDGQTSAGFRFTIDLRGD